MIKALCARMKQGYRTLPFPARNDVLPERFLGRPCISPAVSQEESGRCIDICPTGAIAGPHDDVSLDLGKCIFCGDCQRVCRQQTIGFSRDYRLAAQSREGLIISRSRPGLETEARNKMKHIFGRSLKLRQVSAGGCNACEADINVLNTLSYDLGRFGIQFVASPRHADGIVVTGPVTMNMRLALKKTYQAVPSPKLVIAVGTCAISGGIFQNHQEVDNGIDKFFPVDMYIPGCPPHPLTILDGLLRVMGHTFKKELD